MRDRELDPESALRVALDLDSVPSRGSTGRILGLALPEDVWYANVSIMTRPSTFGWCQMTNVLIAQEQ